MGAWVARDGKSQLGCQRSAWGSNLWLPASCEAVLVLPSPPHAAEGGGGRLETYSFKLTVTLLYTSVPRVSSPLLSAVPAPLAWLPILAASA